jgi:hypothetical protein
VKNVLLVNAPLTILFLRDTYGGHVHDKHIDEATPSPLPAGSRLLQDLGFLAFTLPDVDILMPTKTRRGARSCRKRNDEPTRPYTTAVGVSNMSTAVSSAVAW